MTGEEIIAEMDGWLAGRPVPSHDAIVATFGSEFLMYRRAWALKQESWPSIERSTSLYDARDEAIRRFGFAIPSGELIEALHSLQPILEIGAGSGYMTALMRAAGIDVVGSDPACAYGHLIRHADHDAWQEIAQGKTMVRRYPDRTVFCSWPSLDHRWFRQALRAMRIGQRVIIVEEDACADSETWDYRDACFALEKEIAVPAWPNMNDRAGIWRKRKGRTNGQTI